MDVFFVADIDGQRCIVMLVDGQSFAILPSGAVVRVELVDDESISLDHSRLQ